MDSSLTRFLVMFPLAWFLVAALMAVAGYPIFPFV